MKRIIALFLGLCIMGMITAQVPKYGAKLVALIDCNYHMDGGDTMVRRVVALNEDNIGIAKFLGRLPDDARLLIINYADARVVSLFEYPRVYDFGFVSHKNNNELIITASTISQADRKNLLEGMLFFKKSMDTGFAMPVDQEYLLSNRNLSDISISNYETAVAHWPDGVSQDWPRSTYLFHPWGLYVDYTVYRNEVVIFNEMYVGALDDSRAPYAAYTVNGDFLFRFPYTIAPLDTMGNYVQMVPGTNRVMLYSHGILGDIYPELKGTALGKQRRDLVFVYELYREDEWPEPLDSSAQLIRIKTDFTGIEKAERFDASRFNVVPGEVPLYGLRGVLTESLVNLRSAPNLQGRVLLLMEQNVHFGGNQGFIILERSQHQDTNGGKTDYWYRIFWRPPEFNATGSGDQEGWVFGSFVKILDPKIPFREQIGK